MGSVTESFLSNRRKNGVEKKRDFNEKITRKTRMAKSQHTDAHSHSLTHDGNINDEKRISFHINIMHMHTLYTARHTCMHVC